MSKVFRSDVVITNNLTASAGNTTFGNTTFNTNGNGITIASTSASEGGQVNFNGGTSYSGSTMQIDNYQGNMRILYNNGNSLALTIDQVTGSFAFTNANATLNGNQIATQSWVTSQGYISSVVSTGTGSVVYNTSPTLLGTVSASNITATGSVTGLTLRSTSNGNGFGIQVGDDAYFGDINVADTISVRGLTGASTNGYFRFGSDTNNFGYNGTNLVYGGTASMGGNFTASNMTSNGYITATGSGNLEATTSSGVLIGMQNGSPRIVFGLGTASSNWEIDAYTDKSFRWYIPGSTKMVLDINGNLSISGSVSASGGAASFGGSLTASAGTTTLGTTNTGALTSTTGSFSSTANPAVTVGGIISASSIDVSIAATATAATNYYIDTGDGVLKPKTLANTKTEIVTTAAVNAASATTLGTVTLGVWQGSSISTTYTDAKVTSVNGSTGAVTGLAASANPSFSGTLSGVTASFTGTLTASGLAGSLLSSATPKTIAGSNSAGTSTIPARDDHTHQGVLGFGNSAVQTVNSTTTAASVTGIGAVALLAGKVYRYRISLLAGVNPASAQMISVLTFPLSSGIALVDQYTDATAKSTAGTTTISASTSASLTHTAPAASVSRPIFIEGVLSTSSAGNFTYSFRPSGTGSVTIQAFSHIYVEEVA